MILVNVFKWRVLVNRPVKVEVEMYKMKGVGYFFWLYYNGKVVKGLQYYGEDEPCSYRDLQEVVPWNCWWLFENAL